MARSLLRLAATALATAVSLGALAACGGSSKPRTVDNKAPAAGDPSPSPGSAAGSPKILSRTKDGGVIQLEGDRPTAMEAANKAMNDHCGAGNYVITQEGEEADADAGPVWRVHYQCQGAAP
jgi:hypothetical protein